MIDRLLTRTEVERRCGLARSTVYRLMRQNLFPLPLKLGGKAVRWPQSEIESWIASRPRATGEGSRVSA
ncbi:MAG: AlpA family transcriptional regulator [Acidobacteriota bacterium]|nr:AlpA family transcriptional regulator [Acidobacteriota bacterium]